MTDTARLEWYVRYVDQTGEWLALRMQRDRPMVWYWMLDTSNAEEQTMIRRHESSGAKLEAPPQMKVVRSNVQRLRREARGAEIIAGLLALAVWYLVLSR